MEVQSGGCLYQISLTHAQIGNKQLTTAQGWIATRLRVKSPKKTHAWGQPGETPKFSHLNAVSNTPNIVVTRWITTTLTEVTEQLFPQPLPLGMSSHDKM